MRHVCRRRDGNVCKCTCVIQNISVKRTVRNPEATLILYLDESEEGKLAEISPVVDEGELEEPPDHPEE